MMENEEITARLIQADEQIKTLFQRLAKVEQTSDMLSELTASVKVLATNMQHMADEQKQQGERLAKLEKAPADDFNHYKRLIIGCVVTGILGAVVGAVIGLILKSGI